MQILPTLRVCFTFPPSNDSEWFVHSLKAMKWNVVRMVFLHLLFAGKLWIKIKHRCAALTYFLIKRFTRLYRMHPQVPAKSRTSGAARRSRLEDAGPSKWRATCSVLSCGTLHAPTIGMTVWFARKCRTRRDAARDKCSCLWCWSSPVH